MRKRAASLSILLVIALFCFICVGLANAGSYTSYTYTLSGGPSSETPLIVDDDLEVKVNAKTVFVDDDRVSTYDGRATWNGTPITFSASPGDAIQIIATNPGGLDIELSPLYLHVNGQSLQLSDGVPNTRREEHGEFFNERFTISVPTPLVSILDYSPSPVHGGEDLNVKVSWTNIPAGWKLVVSLEESEWNITRLAADVSEIVSGSGEETFTLKVYPANETHEEARVCACVYDEKGDLKILDKKDIKTLPPPQVSIISYSPSPVSEKEDLTIKVSWSNIPVGWKLIVSLEKSDVDYTRLADDVSKMVSGSGEETFTLKVYPANETHEEARVCACVYNEKGDLKILDKRDIKVRPKAIPEYLYVILIALFIILLPFVFYARGKRKKPATTSEKPSTSPEQKEILRQKVKQEALINVDYHLKWVNEEVRKVFLELIEKLLRLGDVEERIKESEVSYNIKNRIIFADFFGFHRDHIWMYLKLNKDVEDLRRETEYDEKGFGIGFKRRLKLTKDTDTDYTVELVKQAIKKTTARDVEKKETPLTLERAIYDPCKRDFVEGQLPRMKEWINRYDPGAYWFAASIQNNTDKAIEEWAVELAFSSALKIEEAKIEGIEYEIPHEAHLGLFKISVPKEYGIVIPKGGAQRVYFKLRADKPKTTYEISGVFKSEITGEVPIRAKEFKYLCDAGVSPEAVKAELKKTFSEKDAARLVLSFKTVQELDRICNRDAKTEEYLDKLLALKNYTEGFSDKFSTQVDEFSRFMKQEQLEYLDDEYKGKVRRFCTNLLDVWINEFLR